MANYGTTSVRMNGKVELLHRGGVVCSIRGMAKEFAMSREMLKRHLIHLKNLKMLRFSTFKEGTIIWVLNYDDVPKKSTVPTQKLFNAPIQPRGPFGDPPVRRDYPNYLNTKTLGSVSAARPGKEMAWSGMGIPDALATAKASEELHRKDLIWILPEETRSAIDRIKAGW